ncbi:NAD(P)/FAD-dependent oxidoreductase [Roseateles koreensis]|uniref:FAD-dependent oxidoreductase n=1 Tax=Roseateles koreensis TaxID=2987526 RepID=A0ABT5KP03_9BURK|nr:FAD-dependent oxidoreductase [Roseateles koreensis]MDC8784576.1 FAD-dependent oxidoreductase [Roseateles koreensis]
MKHGQRSADVLIVGGGIIGAACAREFSRQGLSVAVIEPGPIGGGATAAAMGHLLVVDAQGQADDAEFQLTRRGVSLWDDWLAESADHPRIAEHERCGTLWVAEDAGDMTLAELKYSWLNQRGIAARMVDAGPLSTLEPLLRPGLFGALLVPGDARIYAPKVAMRWIQEARVTHIEGRLSHVDGHAVHLCDGRTLWGAMTVLCAGLSSQAWLPAGSLIAKKGQLAITQRYPGLLRHQVVELGYLRKAHLSDQDSVAFNVQPRPGGQILIGSSRQFAAAGQTPDPAIDLPVLKDMLAHACRFMPKLAPLNLLRTWTGLRPASRDGRPLIGAHPEHARLWLATGHEGLGLTTALSTAELLVDLCLQRPTQMVPEPWAPCRFFNTSA